MEKAQGWWCEICTLQFSAYKPEQRPMMIECGHTFCGTCMTSFAGKCPKCRKQFNPERSVPNFSLLDLLENLRECKLTESTFEEPVPHVCPPPVQILVPVPFPFPVRMPVPVEVQVQPPAKETRNAAASTSGIPQATDESKEVLTAGRRTADARIGEEKKVEAFPYL